MGTRGHCGWVPPSQPTGPPASTCSLPGPVLSLRPGPSEVTSQQQEESPSCLPRGADSALRGPVSGLDPGAGSPRGHLDQARVPCLGGIPRGSWWQMTQNAPYFPPGQLWLHPSQVHPGSLRHDGRLQGRLFQKPLGGFSLLWGK